MYFVPNSGHLFNKLFLYFPRPNSGSATGLRNKRSLKIVQALSRFPLPRKAGSRALYVDLYFLILH